MLPSMNAYEQWTATPGIPGEALENVALSLKFEGMGAQVCGMWYWHVVHTYLICGMWYVRLLAMMVSARPHV